ncbi:hypothetical protein HOP62_01620 [Halomonas sp. MCCC 1A17488]|uniref:Uncharacterized protein n=1 Tax=Billgrantia sulfidoxydans TaxID=2733484 RepID=A0ABX7W5J3_9GAMM|nr:MULTISPECIES: hypothetical protein [Halomonas]MCE8014769.1 hypothetical protein [Halomonas sp. MCCC 1A17488]MCG3238102.1 hypothetical protein [Halomonas sp. MCCC 1A17488]QPP48126.1 hypothetical protein I4484_12780 [Halomonas sp. SS10-MC5]QTP55415.1 hypothetical protein HNO51_12405 [Halomonas sulfidoxydans]
MNKVWVAAACVAGIGAGIYLHNARNQAERVSPDELTPDQQRYCEQVEQWYREEMLDVAPKWRLGHPDEQGTYTQWCADR